jgi:hypothetical protein
MEEIIWCLSQGDKLSLDTGLDFLDLLVILVGVKQKFPLI